MAYIRAAATLALLLLSGCAGLGGGPGRYDYTDRAPDSDFDRSGFGEAPLPFWCAVTPPEIKALRDKDKAAAGDARALLALAIFASGDKRRQAQYDSIAARLEAFVAKVRPEVDAEGKVYQKGFVLHRAMHREYFPPYKSEGDLGGYDFDQSTLTGIFADGRFNCVSSAILYVILARHFGLKVNGVVLSSHVFAQLETPEGRIIEVETTSPTGYDWVHDEAFYQGRGLGWLSSRGLGASTFADYRKRKIVEPIVLIGTNMGNQHTFASRMASGDRWRLIEARGYVADADTEAQNNRMAFYNSEYAFLHPKRPDLLEKMFRQVTPVFPQVGRRGGSGLRDHVAWGWLEYALVLQELARPQEAFARIDSAMAGLDPASREGAAISGAARDVVRMIAADWTDKKRFSEAEAVLVRYQGTWQGEGKWKESFYYLYGKWAEDFWNKGDWEAVLARFEKRLGYADKDGVKNTIDNMGIAYVNEAVVSQQQGDWNAARKALERCRERLPEAKTCRSRLQELLAAHNFQ
jgi:tetratricopeptide (TPR) repeat protein